MHRPLFRSEPPRYYAFPVNLISIEFIASRDTGERSITRAFFVAGVTFVAQCVLSFTTLSLRLLPDAFGNVVTQLVPQFDPCLKGAGTTQTL